MHRRNFAAKYLQPFIMAYASKNTKHKVFITQCLLLLCTLIHAQNPATQVDSAKTLHQVTVQTERIKNHKSDNVITLAQVAMPTLVIDQKTIALMGSRRLDEVMREQTGVAIVSNLGAGNRSVGVQMQGFSAEYITILIDGQPMAGRNSGNLDLSRLSISNIERIEIIKGASSSLYGSEALGGVINIITRQHVSTPQASVKALYGTNKTVDATLETENSFAHQKGAAFFSADYYTTGGFNVNPYLEKNSQTAPPYNSLSLMGRSRYQVSPSGTLHFIGRYSNRSSTMTRDYSAMATRDKLNENDINTMVSFDSRPGNRTRLIGRYYFTRYASDQQVSIITNSHALQQDKYTEYIHRAEWQASHTLANNSITFIAGTGGEYQHINAVSQGASGHMYNYFAYTQANYTPTAKLGIIAGLRYDGNNVYGGKVNPSVGVHISPLHWLTLKAAAGKGYKSPGYRQLYQVFTNVTQGYTVIGANVFTTAVNNLKNAGLIQQVWPLASGIVNLQAETSTSINAGFSIKPLKKVEINLNVFYNDIRNLINTQQVGIKTNGGQLFSYLNIAHAYTKGLEAGLTVTPFNSLVITGGYQLLYARDLSVIDAIKNRAPQSDTVRSYPSPRPSVASDYFGLPGRSRHMANLQLFYEWKPMGLSLSARANYRGKYGFLDTDNNGFIDPFDVYVKGYTLLNASLQKKLLKEKLVLQLTVDNITNYTDYLMPAQPGRMILAGFTWKFFEKEKI